MKTTSIDMGEGIGVWAVNTILDPHERAAYTRAGLELRISAKNQLLAALEHAVNGCAFVTTDGKDLSLAMQRQTNLTEKRMTKVAKKAVAQATRAYKKALRSYWS